jgi:hypothetical protein
MKRGWREKKLTLQVISLKLPNLWQLFLTRQGEKEEEEEGGSKREFERERGGGVKEC